MVNNWLTAQGGMNGFICPKRQNLPGPNTLYRLPRPKMRRAMLARFQRRQHVRPDLDVVIHKVVPQFFGSFRMERTFEQHQFLACPLTVPCIAATCFNPLEPG